ncbi:hypothetical protein MNBD_GAMMA11-903 [hydrothermal vent metagenome]|uniref:Uncharacterized protein n=1 Tax=hydrothermal vent metagenome TaxID=652676 RepID=A0A3B0XMD2_9ZZZZ
MNKDDWYQDRILWRANQNKLLEKGCKLFSGLLDEQRAEIVDLIKEDINPVLVFWENPKTWTVMGTRAICSCHHDLLNITYIDEIKKKVVVLKPSDVEEINIKTEANLILLEETGAVIWAPPGAELFALMNILLMFPLKEKR